MSPDMTPARPEKSVIRTTCPRDCYDACGIAVLKSGGEITKVLGDPASGATNPRGSPHRSGAMAKRARANSPLPAGMRRWPISPPG